MPRDLNLSVTLDSSQENASVAALAGGGFVAVWTDWERDYGTTGFDGFSGVYGQRFDEAGRKVGLEFQVHQREKGQQFDARVVGLANGGFVVGWTGQSTDQDDDYESGLDAYLRRFDAEGIPTTPEWILNAPSTMDHRLQDLLVLADGTLAVTWVQSPYGTDWSLVQRNFRPNGAPLGASRVIDTDMDTGLPQGFFYRTPGFRMTELPGGGYGATWWEFAAYPFLDEVFYARFTSRGQIVGRPVLVSTPSEDDANFPEIATLAGGNVAIAWTVENDDDLNDEEVWVRVLTADGVPLGAAGRVNEPTPEDDVLGDVVALPDGGFLVTFSRWNEAESDFPYDYYTVEARRFDAAGRPLGRPFLVGETVYEDGTANAAVALPSGGVVVTWTGGGTIEEDVYASLVSRGTAFADRFDMLFPGAAQGFDGDDRIGGTTRADRIQGDGGDDTIDGRSGDDRLHGGAGDDRLAGGTDDDVLLGASGNDLLRGGAGRDRLDGGVGRDWIEGGAGADLLAGGTGRDRFRFDSLAEIAPGEAILDLERGDRIDVRAIDADPTTPGDQAFRFLGGGGFTGDGSELRLEAGRLLFDVDGDRIADAVLALPGIGRLVDSQLLL